MYPSSVRSRGLLASKCVSDCIVNEYHTVAKSYTLVGHNVHYKSTDTLNVKLVLDPRTEVRTTNVGKVAMH